MSDSIKQDLEEQYDYSDGRLKMFLEHARKGEWENAALCADRVAFSMVEAAEIARKEIL